MPWFMILQAALSIFSFGAKTAAESGIFHGGAEHTAEAVSSAAEVLQAVSAAQLNGTSVPSAVSSVTPHPDLVAHAQTLQSGASQG